MTTHTRVCFYTAELRPQLDTAHTRLDRVQSKHTDMRKQLETVQNNMNFTTSTHTHTRFLSDCRSASTFKHTWTFVCPHKRLGLSLLSRHQSGDPPRQTGGGASQRHCGRRPQRAATHQRAAGPMAAELWQRQCQQ